MNRAFPENENTPEPPDKEITVNLTDDMLELMRRRYREAHGHDAPDDQTMIEQTMRGQMLILALGLNPELEAMLRADAAMEPEERKVVRDFIERSVAEAVANDREPWPHPDPPTPEEVIERARKITES